MSPNFCAGFTDTGLPLCPPHTGDDNRDFFTVTFQKDSCANVGRPAEMKAFINREKSLQIFDVWDNTTCGVEDVPQVCPWSTEWEERGSVPGAHREPQALCSQSSADMTSLSWEQHVRPDAPSSVGMFEGAEWNPETRVTRIITAHSNSNSSRHFLPARELFSCVCLSGPNQMWWHGEKNKIYISFAGIISCFRVSVCVRWLTVEWNTMHTPKQDFSTCPVK